MVCIGMATYRHRTEVRTPGRLDARRDYSALSATLIEQNDSEPLAACEVLVCRMGVPGKADSRRSGAAGRSNRRRQRRDNR